MAVPKRRLSRARTRARRAQWKASEPALVPVTVEGRTVRVPRRLVRAVERGLVVPSQPAGDGWTVPSTDGRRALPGDPTPGRRGLACRVLVPTATRHHDVVVPSRLRRPRIVLAVLASVAVGAVLAGCASGTGLPERDPDVTATVFRTTDAAVLTDADDAYYKGMSLADDLPVVGGDGAAATVAGLVDGDRVRVWIGGSCAESWPVLCEIVGVELVD